MQPLLESLCKGVTDQEVPAALQGLLAHSAHTRFAALAALPLLPCLTERERDLSKSSVSCMPFYALFWTLREWIHGMTISLPRLSRRKGRLYMPLYPCVGRS